MIDPDLPPRLAQFRVTLRLFAFHLQPFLGRRLARTLPPALVRVVLRSFELLLVSALIELAMSLPMAIYFHRVTALGLPVNLLVVPLIGLALPSALITFACLLVWPGVAILPAAVTAGLLHSISGIVQLFSAMGAGDIRIPNPGNLAMRQAFSSSVSRFGPHAIAGFQCGYPLLRWPAQRLASFFPGPWSTGPGCSK